MPNLKGWEWLIIILLIVVLFGAKRLPDAARSVGRSLRIFKAETKGLVEGEAEPAQAPPTAQGQATAAPAAQAAPTPELPTSGPASGAAAPEQPAPQAQAQPPHQA
jgi:sec-independent protein translocase protein TatA